MNHKPNDRFSKSILLIGLSVLLLSFALASQAWAEDTSDNGEDKPETEQVLGSSDESMVTKYQRTWLVLWGEQKVDGPTGLIILGIGSAILHAVAANALAFLSLFAKSLKDPVSHKQEGVSMLEATTMRYTVYYLVAAIAAVVILRFICHLELLEAVGFVTHEVKIPWQSFVIPKGDVDALVTGIVMWLGTERVGHWLQIPGGPASQALQPVIISGDLVLNGSQTELAEN